MSWDSYIESLKGYCPDRNGVSKMKNAVICGADGNKWASSPGFNPSQQELSELVKVCKENGSERAKAYTEGIRLANEKFTFVRADDDEKKVEFKHGKSVGSAMATNQCVVICVVEGENDMDSAASNAVYQTGTYLRGSGY